jgi:hypothetical protein
VLRQRGSAPSKGPARESERVEDMVVFFILPPTVLVIIFPHTSIKNFHSYILVSKEVTHDFFIEDGS